MKLTLAGKSSMQPRSNCNVRWLSRISRNFVSKLQAIQRKCLSVLEISECAVCLLAWVCDALGTLVFPMNVYACLFFFWTFFHPCTFIRFDNQAILSENTCHFVNFAHFSKQLLLSQLDINHVTQEPTTKNQRTCRPSLSHQRTFNSIVTSLNKEPSTNDVSSEGEGGLPKSQRKEMKLVPCFGQSQRSL